MKRVHDLDSGHQCAVEGCARTEDIRANVEHYWALRCAEKSDANTTVRSVGDRNTCMATWYSSNQ